jgi:hemerythrin-like domain-containing protein
VTKVIGPDLRPLHAEIARNVLEESMGAATKILREEHDVILKMLEALEAAAHRVEAGYPVPLNQLADFHEFFRLFADRSHHGKEEELLFPLLERNGVPRVGGPVGCMLVEHDDGRAFVKTIADSADGCALGDESARKLWVGAARSYANLLRNHIWKENEILFRIADRLISSDEQVDLATEFSKLEKKLGPGTHARLRKKWMPCVSPPPTPGDAFCPVTRVC